MIWRVEKLLVEKQFFFLTRNSTKMRISISIAGTNKFGEDNYQPKNMPLWYKNIKAKWPRKQGNACTH